MSRRFLEVEVDGDFKVGTWPCLNKGKVPISGVFLRDRLAAKCIDLYQAGTILASQLRLPAGFEALFADEIAG